jgi:C4-dicarboxylate transporter, DctM subunit
MTVSTAAAPAGGLAAVERICTQFSERIAFLGVLGMLFVAFATVGDVLLRWLFNSPIGGLIEITQMGIAASVAATFPAGVMRRVNLSIDVLGSHMTPRAKAWLPIIGDVSLIAIFFVLAWQMAVFTIDAHDNGALTNYLRLPHSWFAGAAAVFFAISFLLQILMTVTRASAALAVARGADVSTPRERTRDLLLGGGLAIVTFGLIVAIVITAQSLMLGWLAALTLALMWVLVLLELPLGSIMAGLGIIGTALVIGSDPSFAMLNSGTFEILVNPNLGTLPLFLIMGSLAVAAGLSRDIYDIANALFGHFRGGLALVTIGSCAGFGTLTGMSLATSVTVGRITLPEMRRRGYNVELATGCVAAGGTLGQLIPPSAALILYALLTEESIGFLFIAAVIPGLIATALYMMTIAMVVRINPSAAPPASSFDLRNLLRVFAKSGAIVILFTVVIGGIYGGFFTVNEAAAVGVVGTVVIALVRGRLSGGALWEVASETVATTALIYLLIIGATTFTFFIGLTGLPQDLVAFIGKLDVAPIVVIFILLGIYIFLGMVMDSIAVMIVTVPIIAPLVGALGYDLVWWGIIMLCVVETGMITPPFGLNVFILKGLAPDVPMQRVFRGVMPFVYADIVKLALLVFFPALALWLPSTMR